MRVQIAFLSAVMLALSVVSSAHAQTAGKKADEAAFSLGSTKYFHRATINDQHEYTPEGQEDLAAWKDMVTIHYYRKATDGDALAAVANAVLQNYQSAKGVLVKTDSVPRTKDKPAEHLVVVILGRPEFIEAVFARFRMHDGVGTAVIYSHRIYGSKIGNDMSAWLQKNGPAMESTLMQWDAMPKIQAPK